MANINFKKDLSNKEFIKFDYEISGDDWKNATKSAKKDLVKNIKIDGYRPGSEAHTKKASAMVKDDQAWMSAIDKVANKAIKELVASEEFKSIEDEVVNAPANLEVKSVSAEKAVIAFAFQKLPEVTLGDYKKLKLTAKEVTVSKDEVSNYIKNIAEKDAMLMPKKGDTIEKGDFVVFDFEGLLDGKAFEGGSSKNFELEIGSNQFIPGFEDQMIGLKKGEKKTIEVTFPKDYQQADLAGKKTQFNLDIHDIKVKEKVEITDEFAKQLNVPEVSNVKELEAHVEKYLTNVKTNQEMDKFKAELFEQLAAITKLSYMDEASVQSELREIKNQLEQTAQQMNMDVDSLVKLFNKDKADFEKEMRAKAEKNVLTRYALIEVSEKEKIECEDKDIEEYTNVLSQMYNIPAEQLKKNIDAQKDFIESMIIVDKTVKWFFDFYKTK